MADTPMFASASYGNIQGYIDAGVLKYPAYVLCKDEAHLNNLVFIDKDLSIRPVKGYEQDVLLFVDELPTENIRTNAFYICDGVGYLFINNIPIPVFKDILDSISSYDQLTDIPIVNKTGDYSSPVVIGELDDGSYSVVGQYKIGGNLETTFSTTRKTFIVETDEEENKQITRFDGNQILIYTINSSGETSQDAYATQSWVKTQGYTTEDYVNQAIEDLYNRIANEALVSITKLSQLENDCGYLTADDINRIGSDDIANFF